MDTNIVLSATDTNNKKLTKTLPDIDPNASNEKLLQFAQGLNSLTTNDYVGSVRVIKTDLDNPDSDTPSTPKLPRNIRLVNPETHQSVPAALSNADEGKIFEVYFDGTGSPAFIIDSETDYTFGAYFIGGDTMQGSGNKTVMFTPVGYPDSMPEPYIANGYVTITVAENDTYEAGELIVTITGSEG